MIQQIPSQVLTREEVATTLDLLDDEGNFAATPLDETWRRSAIQVLKSRASLTALDRGVTLSMEEESLMLEGIARSMRTAIGLATKEDGKENATQRGEEEMAAMEKLVAWVRAAGRGTEAIRREHWYALIGDQRYTPHATFRLSARMLAHGVALPPWSATRPLRAEDRHPDRGTLVWRGEPLVSDPAMTRMLDALGVRNLDLNVPDLNAGSGRVLPEALALEGISVATLGGTGSLGQEAMETLLERLGEELPGLYLVRLTGTDACRTTIALPPPWTRTSDPGLLVHADRNANRQRLDPLRGLWPGRSLPPAFRARAMNVHPGGEAVLELLGTVRNQRSSDTRFKKQDPGLALLLEPIIGGLAEDADFARRCEPLAKMPDGPCSDGGFSTLQAMVAMRDLRQAGSLQEVALHTLTIACKQRIDAWVGESRPGFNENLESAMVLRWFMTQLLREILGTDQIRLADKPMFGGAAEGEDWDSPERHSQFRRVALRLIAAEASDGFPGIVAMMAREKDAMGELTQARLDEEPELRALAARSEALREACNHGNPEDVRRTKAALGTIDAQRGEMRMALLQPLLAPMREQVLDAARRATQPPAGDDGPPAKRPRS
jgi:hypothetical protein